MKATIIEIKARCREPEAVRRVLREHGARFVGEDHQVDTYYVVPRGRLKFRSGNIENTLIHYHRPDRAGPKLSDVRLFKTKPNSDLKHVLDSALERLIIVDKLRQIYFVDNVKFHIDRVEGLGSFVEIEAIDEDGTRTEEELLTQCSTFLRLFNIDDDDLVECSYSDLLLINRPT
jgi:adenylate cyclase, class 2